MQLDTLSIPGLPAGCSHQTPHAQQHLATCRGLHPSTQVMASFTPARSQRAGLLLLARRQGTLMWGLDLQLVHSAPLSLQEVPCCCTPAAPQAWVVADRAAQLHLVSILQQSHAGSTVACQPLAAPEGLVLPQASVLCFRPGPTSAAGVVLRLGASGVCCECRRLGLACSVSWAAWARVGRGCRALCCCLAAHLRTAFHWVWRSCMAAVVYHVAAKCQHASGSYMSKDLCIPPCSMQDLMAGSRDMTPAGGTPGCGEHSQPGVTLHLEHGHQSN